MARYDFIIAGAGAAGLSLLVHFIRSGKFADKKILLVERGPKRSNDRTWCFWETTNGPFEEIVHCRWNKLWFHGQRSVLHDVSPYQYKLIRGIDFYNYCFALIAQQPNITVRYGQVNHLSSGDGECYVMVDGERLTSQWLFNSLLFDRPTLAPGEFYMLQHFKGWLVETEGTVFHPQEATLMDFRVPQDHGTSFVYVMPFSTSQALVEYTLFSKTTLAGALYEEALRNYCEVFLSLRDYRIRHTEFGIIPMTNHRFTQREGNLIHIGTAGGQTKASSGYTFQFIQKQCTALVNAWDGKQFAEARSSFFNKRFHYYDSILLDILYNRRMAGAEVFNILFQSNPLADIFKFLDNETSLSEELSIIRELPRAVFLRSALKVL